MARIRPESRMLDLSTSLGIVKARSIRELYPMRGRDVNQCGSRDTNERRCSRATAHTGLHAHYQNRQQYSNPLPEAYWVRNDG